MSAFTGLTVLALATTAASLLASTTTRSMQCSGSSSSNARVALAAMPSEEFRADIVDTAIGAGSFKTLVAAVQAADLVDALRGDGPFTVFAPTDDAFARLPAGTVDSLLRPENRAKLQAILLYHVVPGKVEAAEVIRRSGATSLNGQRIPFSTDGSVVRIDTSKVAAADIMCSNGVIHVIDSVILPATDDIVTLADSTGSFSTLLAAAKAAGLVDALKSSGPITVFAPTDDAFAKLPAGTVESLLEPENREMLAAVLTYHVVPGRVFAMDPAKAGRATTLQGEDVIIDIRDGRLTISGATVISTDINASNGVVHILDRVILPPSM
jgi:transforming growth factor-beta-induced protein